MLRLGQAVAGLLFAVVGFPANAVTYTDLWFNPSEGGWGVNITQQGMTLFAMWFVYAEDGKPTWFSMSNRTQTPTTPKNQNKHNNRTKPEKTEAFNPAQVALTKVGTASFSFDTSNTVT